MNIRSSNRLDGRAVDAALVTLQQKKELKMENIVEFEPTKRFAKIEEAIQEAVAKARENQCTFRFDCNDFIMLIDGNSDVNTLISKYWEFKHKEGIANGTIISIPVNYPSS